MALFSRSKYHLDQIASGDRARDAQEWAVAARHYGAALAQQPNNSGIWVQFGHAMKESGQLGTAENAYRRALEHAPLVADTHVQLGHVLKLQNRHGEAREAYLRALAIDPDGEHARLELSAFEWRDEELAVLRQTIPSTKKQRRRLSPNELADRARDLGQWEDAARFYRKAIDRNPHAPELWVQYGNMLKESGKFAEAEAALRTALAYGPAVADTHLQLGHVLKRSGHPEHAADAYLRAFALDENQGVALAELDRTGWTAEQISVLRWHVGEELSLEEATDAIPSEDSAPVSVAEDGGGITEPTDAEPLFLGSPDASILPNPQQLRSYLVNAEFGIGHASANRVLKYFSILGALERDNIDARRRSTIISSLKQRLTRLSKAAAGDSRPIEASIIIPTFDHIGYTLAATLSLLEHRCDTRYEIIIGNDVSRDETRDVFESIGGIVNCITHETNAGFLSNCNISAQHALGKYVVFLNNDTLILDDWLDELLSPFRHFKNVGLTGSKLLMSDGSLQEAGGILWSDASAWNFGRGQHPSGYQFNYAKDADYVSGAAIALPKALWDELGGFDERYLPAYAEDADIAFRIRAKGLRTLYAPHSEIIHHEGVSHGTDVSTGGKAYQLINQKKFADRWQELLRDDHFENGNQIFLARDHSRHRKHILVFDHYVPKVDRDGGSRLMYDLLRMLIDADLHVSFWPDNGHYDREYARELQNLGIEILYGPLVPHGFREWIKEFGEYYDYAFLHRPHVSEHYIDDLQTFSPAKRIFYGSDLHFRRLEREYALTGRAEVLEEVKVTRRLEAYCWNKSDVIYYPSPDEVALVQQHVQGTPVRRFPVQIYSDKGVLDARNRVGQKRPQPPIILYVAGFAHHPNVDGILWFAREVLPFVKRRVPESVTVIAGSFPPRSVTSLARDDIIVTQAVSWSVLDWLYNSATVVVAPLRYGGGMKGKVLEAMRYGVPVVTTTAGAEGFDEANEILAAADTPEAFAERVAEVIRAPSSAENRILRALDYVARNFSYTAAASRLAIDIPELERIPQGRGILKL